MAQRYGYGMGVGLLEGAQVGHGFAQDKIANERADRAEAMRTTAFNEDRAALAEQRQRGDLLFDQGQEDRNFALEQRKMTTLALRAKNAMYNPDGTKKDPAKWDRAALARIGNEMDVFKQYLASNPEVDPNNPLLEVVPLKTTKGTEITFRLNRADGGIGVLTRNRSSDPNDAVVSLTPDEFETELNDIFAGYGVAIPSDPHAWEKQKAATDQANKLEQIRTTGEEARKTASASAAEQRKTAAMVPPGDVEDKNAYKDLPDDVKSMLGDTQVDDLTGKAVTILDPVRVNSFLNFWKNSSGEKDPRKAITMFKDFETINSLSAADIKKQLDENPASQKYIVGLMSAQKRAELRKFMNGGVGGGMQQ